MAEFKRCPLCGASVKLENIERHAQRSHPGKKVDFGLSEAEETAIKTKPKRRRPIRRTERVLYPVLVVIVVVVVVIAGLWYLNPPPADNTGTRAPDFNLMSSDGEAVHLWDDFRDKVVLLDFMDTDCPACRAETTSVLVPLYAIYGARVEFVSVDVRFIGEPDTFDDILAFKASTGASWTYVLDEFGAAADAYDIASTPTTYILQDLTIHAVFGRSDQQTLSDALDAALEG